MIHYVFDLDDTLIIHKKGVPINYEMISEDRLLDGLLGRCNGPCYIYTNGTGGHALDVIQRMKIKDRFEKVYSRDTIPYMKPDYRSFNDVHDDISYRSSGHKVIFFFDDLLSNLEAASRQGWITFWINPDYMKGKQYSFVNMSFPNINDCLRYLETKY